MSFHFGQVLGSTVTKSDPQNELKIEQSGLQKRRALNKIRSNSTISSRIGPTTSSSYFNSRSSVPISTQSNQLITDQSEVFRRKLDVPPLSSTTPLTLASKAVLSAIDKDNNVPPLTEVQSKFAIDNYNYNPDEPLRSFSRFEKAGQYSIPQRLFQESNSLDCISNMGVLKEIQKAWLTIENKLIIWNYQAAAHEQEYFTIDEFKHPILTVALVKPKPKVFVDSVNYLLIVATSMDIHILAVEYHNNKLEIADTKMSVPTQGLLVNKFVTFDKTNEILFTGIGDSENIWKLTYSNTEEWFHRNCSKECLTKSNFSAVVPGYNVLQKIPGLKMLTSDSSDKSKVETTIDLQIDQSRNILYTLSSKSIIKAYKLKLEHGKVVLGSKVTKRPYDLLRDLSTTTFNLQSPLLNKNLKVINVFPVTKSENSNLFLIAVTNSGCRFFINGSTYGERLSLNTSFVKFPPPDAQFNERVKQMKQEQLQREQEFITSGMINSAINTGIGKSITKSPVTSTLTLQDVKQAQESSTLLKDLKHSLIISPNIFIGHTEDKKVFSSTPDFGILKKTEQYIEDFESIEDLTGVHSIVQLTPSFNPTKRPRGYCNEFASQYTASPLEFAVLTGAGIHIFRYRTPDLILEDSLDDKTFAEFSDKYGSEEACSTSLYLACKYGKPNTFKNLATNFFISGGKNAKLNKNFHAMIDNVELSDRFYATVILISRLVRDFWNKEVFKFTPGVAFNKSGYIDLASVKKLKNNKVILSGLNISKSELEYFLCSLLIIINFFEENKKTIPGLAGAGYQVERNKETEICLQAEQFSFNALITFLNTLKEGLSFLAILLDDNDVATAKNFETVMTYLSLQSQADLSCLSFGEFLTSNDPYVSKLVKEILCSVINKSIATGNSVEIIANTLQEKCGSFCSADDVLIFKAIESLKKAKDYSNNNDHEMKKKCLQIATKLLEQTSDSLSVETITDSVNIMLQLDYYVGAIQFLLSIATGSDKSKLALQLDSDSILLLPSDDPKKKAYDRRVQLYGLVFQILVDIDERAILSIDHASQSSNLTVDKSHPAVFVSPEGQIITQHSQLRDQSYETCLTFKDKLFHYEFYKWFINNGIGEKLLEIDTPYILDFLKDYSSKDFEMAKLLWIYYSKRENYFEAAKILFELSLSPFEIDLANRIHFLSRANGFCNCIPPANVKQDVVYLASQIIDLMSVANLQDELLMNILQDSRVDELAKQTATGDLNGTILTVSDLFNDFIDPLGYYELALITFKVSDHRNSEDILIKWESLLNKWFVEYSKHNEESPSEPFYSQLSHKFILIGSRLSDSDVLFPIIDLFQLLAKYSYSDEFSKESKPHTGLLVDTFLKSGLSYGKLYYNLRELIESTTYEVFKNYSKCLKDEMCYLIQSWYKNDKKLRDIIPNDTIRELNNYSSENDPVYNYIRTTGNPL